MRCDGGKYHCLLTRPSSKCKLLKLKLQHVTTGDMGRFTGRPLDFVWFVFLFVSRLLDERASDDRLIS